MSTSTWAKNEELETEMADSHLPLWKAMIERCGKLKLRGKTVLDFGCNRGGFLKLLYAMRPFAEGIGVDIADASIDYALAHRENVPATYIVCYDVSKLPWQFDAAFSHEVLYLLPDLKKHAKQIASRLRQGATYYIALGCHTANPLWKRWKKELVRHTDAEFFDYSPQDVEQSLEAAGFDVAVKAFNLDYREHSGSPPLAPWFPDENARQRFFREDNLLFAATLRDLPKR